MHLLDRRRAAAVLALLAALSSAGRASASPARLGRAVPSATESPQEALERLLAGYRLRRVWTMEDGLPQGSVTSLAQTPDGFLWVGTHGGLARFDGRRFEVYTPRGTPALTSSRIAELVTDQEGTLWIGFQGPGVARWRGGRFLGTETLTGEGLRGVAAIRSAPNRSIWLAGNGVGSVEGTAYTKVAVPDDLGLVYSMAIGPDGSAWVAGTRILQITSAGLQPLEGDGAPSHWRMHFVAASPDLGVFGRAAPGFFRIGEDGAVSWLDSGGRLDGAVIHRLLRGPQGRDLLATEEGVFQAEIQGSQLLLRSFLPEVEGSNACALVVDHEGGLWVGLEREGLAHFIPRDTIEIPAHELGLFHDSSSVGAGQGGGFFLTTSVSPWLWEWTPESGFEPRVGPGSPTLEGAKQIVVARDSTVWIRQRQALLEWRDATVVRHEVSELGDDSGLGQVPLFEDHQGRIWCGSEGMLHCFDGVELQSYSSQDGLSLRGVPYVFAAGPEGTVWASDGEQVVRLTQDALTCWSQADGLPAERVRALQVSPDGELWVGSYGGGLSCLRGDRFVSVTSEQGLHDDFVSRIEIDDSGSFWINSNRGAFRVQPEELRAVVEGRQASVPCMALRTDEAYGGAGCRLPTGQIVFRTVSGWALIDPQRVAHSSRPPKASIRSVEVNGQRTDVGPTIRIPPGRRNVVFHFSAPAFSDPENTQYECRLVGLDSTWESLGRAQAAHFPNLPSGEFRFEVGAVGSGGVRGPTASVDLDAQPYLHESPWFLGGCIMLLTTIVIMSYELRHRRALREQEALQKEIVHRTTLERRLHDLAGRLISIQEQERRRIARDLHDDLSQRLALLAVDLQLLGRRNASGAKHGLADVQRLTETVQEISATARRAAHELHPAILDQLGLCRSLRALCESFEERGIGVSWHEAGSRRLPPDVELNVYRAAQEALQNVLQHSEARHVEVSLEIGREKLRLVVADDGRGFDADNEVCGLGQLSMSERMNLLGGRAEVVSRPGQGTRVILEVPLEPEEPPHG